MNGLEHFKLLANYNQRINQQVYEAASQLSVEERSKDRGAFFQSIEGTLNHIMIGDLFWLGRYRKHSPDQFLSLKALEIFPKPQALAQILFTDFAELRHHRALLDSTLLDWTSNELSEEDLNCVLEYKNTQGKLFRKPFSEVLSHLFNHQTHHRGQVSTLLSQLGIDIGPTDFVFDIPNIQ